MTLTNEGVPMIYNLYPNAILDDSDVNNMVWVKKNLAGGETYWRHADGDLGVYERYNNLLVGINNDGGSRTQSVYTSLNEHDAQKLQWNRRRYHDRRKRLGRYHGSIGGLGVLRSVLNRERS